MVLVFGIGAYWLKISGVVYFGYEAQRRSTEHGTCSLWLDGQFSSS